MKSAKARIRAALLAAAVFLVLAPATAFAQGQSQSMTGQEFVNSAEQGVITLDGDVVLTSTAAISEDLTINLNGHTLSRDASDEKFLKVLLLDIGGGSVTIEGPGTITGGEFGDVNLFSPEGVINVSGAANLTVRGGAEINGGKIASNGTIGDFRALCFSSEGTLSIEESRVVGLYYGNRESDAAVYASGKATVKVSKSTIIGGASGSATSGNALELRTKGAAPAEIVDSILIGGGDKAARQGGNGLYLSENASAKVTGGTITGGHGTSGGHGVNVAGSLVLDGVEISGGTSRTSTPGVGVYCTMPATTVDIKNCTVSGGSPAEGCVTNSAGRGMEIYGPVQLTIENSSILGGNNNRRVGDIIGGNAIWFYDEDSIDAKITLIDTVLDVGNEVAYDAVISGTNNAPAGPNGKILATITAGGTLTVNGGTLANTTITPAAGGLELVGAEDATVDVGKNQLTVVGGATVEDEARVVFFSTASDALENAEPGSTVVITEVKEGEQLPELPVGVELKNDTEAPIVVGGQTVEPNGTVANHVAKIGGIGYLLLTDALAAAQAGDTVDLLADVVQDGAIIVPTGVTLNGNGSSITCGQMIPSGAFITAGGDGVVLKNVVVSTDGKAKHGVQFYCTDGGGLQGVTVNGGSYTSVIVNGATNVAFENVTLDPDAGAYAHIEFGMGSGVASVPSLSVSGVVFKDAETTARIWVDNATVERVKEALGGQAADEQVVAKVKESIDNKDQADLGIKVEIAPGQVEDVVVEGYTPPVVIPEYEVVVLASENGSVVSDVERADAGDIVTITVVPDKGFELDFLAVVDEQGKAVGIKPEGAGIYAFEMPASDVTIAATFACDGGGLCPSSVFPDVDQTQWYHAAVDWAYVNRVMTGFESGAYQGLFGPDMDLTRAQMAKILWNIAGNPQVDLELDFADVSKDDWFYGAIAWAVSEGIYEGYVGSDLFGPDDPLKREQAAAVLMRWTATNGGDVSARADLSEYPDAGDVTEWAVEYMSWAVGAGVLRGAETPEGGLLLDPQSAASRAEAAMLMMRLTE